MIYPNPADAFVTFDYQLPEYQQESTLLVVDITGKEVFRTTLKGHQGQYLLDTRQIAKGLYFYSLTDDKDNILSSGKLSILK